MATDKDQYGCEWRASSIYGTGSFSEFEVSKVLLGMEVPNPRQLQVTPSAMVAAGVDPTSVSVFRADMIALGYPQVFFYQGSPLPGAKIRTGNAFWAVAAGKTYESQDGTLYFEDYRLFNYVCPSTGVVGPGDTVKKIGSILGLVALSGLVLWFVTKKRK